MCEYYTHRAGGLLAGALVLQFYHAPPEIWPGALLLSAIASAVPDLDHTQSTAQSASMNELTNNIPVAGTIFGWLMVQGLRIGRKFLGKREATHSILLAAVIWWGIRHLWPGIPPPMLYAIIAGFISHPLIDTFNPEGARLLWPFGPKFSLARFLPWPFTFKTGSRVEKFIMRPVLWVSSMWLIFGHSFLPRIT